MNLIASVLKYAPEALDKIFMAEAKTKVLEKATIFNFTGVKTVKLPDISMSGYGSYSRAGNEGSLDPAYPRGGVTLGWTDYTLTQDRGIEFLVDALDNEEAMSIVMSNLLNEFARTKEVPELDAYRLSTLYSLTPSGNKEAKAITANTIIATFNEIAEKYADDEVPTDQQQVIAFISTAVDTMFKNTTELTKKITQEDYSVGKLSFKVRMYDDFVLVPVPKTRFKTEYTFNSGRTATGESLFGFTPQETAKDISILCVHRDAPTCIIKHAPVKHFAPEVNQHSDSHKIQLRLHHDIIVPKNMRKGIRAITKP